MSELNKLTKEELIARLAQEEEARMAAEAALTAEKTANTSSQDVVNHDPRRRVKIKLFKDNSRYSEPLSVSVNDYTAVIKRGVEVEVPYFVAKHLEEVAAQDEATAAMIGQFVADWSSKAR